jgi:drug/metabolite transporter (DMT)-like permease
VTHARAYALLALVTVIWAGNYPLGKLGLSEFGPITLAAARALFAIPLLLLVARLLEPDPRPLKRGDYRAFAILSLTGLVGNTTIWYWGLKYTSPVAAGILGASAPVVISLSEAALLGTRLSRANALGIALTLAAVLLTVTRGSLEALWTLSLNKGDLILLSSQIAWVTYTLYSRAHSASRGPATLQAGAHVISAAVLLPLCLTERPWAALGHASWAGWAVVVYSAGPITLGHLWYYQCVRVVGAGKAAIYMNVMPFLVIGLSWAMLGETLRWYQAIGACVVIAGVILATRR